MTSFFKRFISGSDFGLNIFTKRVISGAGFGLGMGASFAIFRKIENNDKKKEEQIKEQIKENIEDKYKELKDLISEVKKKLE